MVKTIRLDKLLSQQTMYSRSEIKKCIKANRVCVNGHIVKKGDLKVNTQTDEVTLDGIEITYEPYVYYVLNKPQGVVSATWDNEWPTVLDLLAEGEASIYEPAPVGRLDKDTTGLLLLTNDGQFNHQIVSPKRHVPKEYEALIQGLVTEKHRKKFAEGLTIDGNETCLPAELFIDSIDEANGQSSIRIILHEGKYHQVKRMFQAIGCEVLALHRIRIGAMDLPSDLALGEYVKETRESLEQKIYHQN